MKEIRRVQILKRKNFLPSLIANLLLWASLGFIIYFLDPFSFGAIFLFFIVLFLSLLFTTALIFGNTRRGLLLSIIIALFLLLRYFGIGNILNLILIIGLGVTIELYLGRK